jgi:hypothetical protein
MQEVKFTKSVRILENENKLVLQLIESIKLKLSEVDREALKYDSQYILDICRCAEKNRSGLSYKKVWNIDTKNIVLKVFSQLYNEVNLDTVENIIDFANDNNLVLKRNVVKLIVDVFFKFF